MNQLLETIPTAWTAADERFFSVVVRLFPTGFLLGATVLLASYDDDLPEVTAPVKVAATPSARGASTPVAAVQASPQ